MEQILAVEVDRAQVRAAIVSVSGLHTPVCSYIGGDTVDEQLDLVRRAVASLGAPSDMWAVVAVEAVVDYRLQSVAKAWPGRSWACGLTADRAAEVLGRPVLLASSIDVLCAGQAWLGAGADAHRVALLWMSADPHPSVVEHGRLLAPAAPATIDPGELGLPITAGVGAHAERRRMISRVRAAVDRHRPDVLIAAARRTAVVEALQHDLDELVDDNAGTTQISGVVIPDDPVGVLESTSVWPVASRVLRDDDGWSPRALLGLWSATAVPDVPL